MLSDAFSGQGDLLGAGLLLVIKPSISGLRFWMSFFLAGFYGWMLASSLDTAE